MRPSTVTDQEIIDAGNLIRKEGGRVTGSAIRKQLGSRGNVERFKRVWETYVEGQGPVGEVEVPALPVEVETLTEQLIEQVGGEVLKLAHAINQTSNRVHEKRVKEITEQASAANEQAAAELKDAANAIEELESDMELIQAEVERHEAHAVEQSSKIAVLESSLTEARQRASEADRLEDEVGDLKQELATLRAEIAQHIKTQGEADTRHVAALEQLRDDHKDAVRELKSSHQAEIETHARSQAEAEARHTKTLDQLRADHKEEVKGLREAHKAELEKQVKAFDQLKLSTDAVTDLSNSQKTQLAVLQEKVRQHELQIVEEKKIRDQQRADHTKEIHRLTSLLPKAAATKPKP